MKLTYDCETDIVRVLLSKATIEESDEDKPGDKKKEIPELAAR